MKISDIAKVVLGRNKFIYDHMLAEHEFKEMVMKSDDEYDFTTVAHCGTKFHVRVRNQNYPYVVIQGEHMPDYIIVAVTPYETLIAHNTDDGVSFAGGALRCYIELISSRK